MKIMNVRTIIENCQEIKGRVQNILYPVLPGDIYYDPRTNHFLQTRQRNRDSWLCGNFTVYYNSAKTIIGTVPLSFGYLCHCTLITQIDHFSKAYYDGIGWRVKEEGLRQ